MWKMGVTHWLMVFMNPMYAWNTLYYISQTHDVIVTTKIYTTYQLWLSVYFLCDFLCVYFNIHVECIDIMTLQIYKSLNTS